MRSDRSLAIAIIRMALDTAKTVAMKPVSANRGESSTAGPSGSGMTTNKGMDSHAEAAWISCSRMSSRSEGRASLRPLHNSRA